MTSDRATVTGIYARSTRYSELEEPAVGGRRMEGRKRVGDLHSCEATSPTFLLFVSFFLSLSGGGGG